MIAPRIVRAMSDMSRQSRGREGPRTQTKEAYCRSADVKDDGVDECPCEQAKHFVAPGEPSAGPDPAKPLLSTTRALLQPLSAALPVPYSAGSSPWPSSAYPCSDAGRCRIQSRSWLRPIPAARAVTKFSHAEQWAEGPRTCCWGCRTGQEVSMPRDLPGRTSILQRALQF